MPEVIATDPRCLISGKTYDGVLVRSTPYPFKQNPGKYKMVLCNYPNRKETRGKIRAQWFILCKADNHQYIACTWTTTVMERRVEGGVNEYMMCGNFAKLMTAVTGEKVDRHEWYTTKEIRSVLKKRVLVTLKSTKHKPGYGDGKLRWKIAKIEEAL